MTVETRQFNLIQKPRNSFLYAFIPLVLSIVIGFPLMLYADTLWKGFGFFLGFFVFGFLLKWFMDRYLHAKIVLTTDRLGIHIEVIQKGLGIPLGASYFVWEQLKRFNYTKWTRGGRYLILQWTDGPKIFFMEKDTELFYQFLCQFYGDREMP